MTAPKIDAHHHVWRLSRGDYGWLTPNLAAIHRDFGVEDLEPLLKRAGIDRTILVQAAPTRAETSYLLDVAARSALIAGVVGWVDFEAPGAADQIAALAARPKLRGLRPMIQDIEDDAWMLRPDLEPAITAMAANRLTFDALLKPHHLPILPRFAARYPDLDIVIDHAAKPDIAGGDIAGWASDIRTVAAETSVMCKLSGLVTEARPGCSVEDLRPVFDVLIESFGAERLMWGSDWPVINLNGAYEVWHDAARTLARDLPSADQDRIFGGAAEAFYGLAA
jgi:L-fuconolactonase